MIESFIAGGMSAMVSALAVVYSKRAEKNSRPVSNGFTTYVLEKLDRIEDKLNHHSH